MILFLRPGAYYKKYTRRHEVCFGCSSIYRLLEHAPKSTWRETRPSLLIFCEYSGSEFLKTKSDDSCVPPADPPEINWGINENIEFCLIYGYSPFKCSFDGSYISIKKWHDNWNVLEFSRITIRLRVAGSQDWRWREWTQIKYVRT